MFAKIKSTLHNYLWTAIFFLLVGHVLTACGDSPTATLVPATATVSNPPTSTSAPTAAQPTSTVVKVVPTNTAAQPSQTTSATAAQTQAAATTVPNGTTPGSVVTPVVLGPAESVLKATGFDGARARALLDELTQQVGPRVFGQESERKAATWVENKFRSWGYTQVEQQKFAPVPPGATTQTPTLTSQNVIATRPANRPDAPVLIFGGHYDTVQMTVGASDNGSGTVLTLEISRVLLQKYPDYELRFIAFGGEEAGLFGSRHYSTQLTPTDKQRIKAFINLDALGVGDRFVAVGTPELVTLAVNTARSNGVRLEAFDLSNTPNSSDHVPFIANGVKSVALLRWLDPLLHKAGDVAPRVYPETLLLGGGTALLLTDQLIKNGA